MLLLVELLQGAKWGWGILGLQCSIRDFLSGSVVKNSLTVQETQEVQVHSLGQKDPLEKGMATHFSTLVWRIPWTEEPGGLQSIGSQRDEYN